MTRHSLSSFSDSSFIHSIQQPEHSQVQVQENVNNTQLYLRSSTPTPTTTSRISSPYTWNEYRSLHPLESNTQKRRLKEKWVRDHTRHCCCFKTKRGCRWTCLLIVFFLILGISLSLFFCWPRLPSVQLENPHQETGNSLYFNSKGDPTESLKTASPSNPFFSYTTLVVPVTVNSSNYINFVLDQVDVTAYLLNANGGPIKTINGTGTMNALLVTAKSTSLFQFPITISFYTSTPVSSLSRNLDLSSLTALCPSSSSKLTLQYSVDITMNSIAWLGIKPSFQSKNQIDCPPPLVELASIAKNAQL